MRIGLRVDKLDIYADLISRFLNGAFQDMGDSELLRDFSEISRCTLVPLRRSARDDFQVGDLREPHKNFLLNTVGEIGVVRIGAQILEWQYGDTFLRRF